MTRRMTRPDPANQAGTLLPAGQQPRRGGVVAPLVVAAVCALGGAVSALSTADHVRFRVSAGTQGGACAALVDSGCKAAHSSVAAELLGVPLSHFGTAFYLAGLGLAVVALLGRRRGNLAGAAAAVAPLISAMGVGAVAYSAYLASLLIRAGEACPLCIALYCLNAALLAVGLTWWLRGTRRPPARSLVVPGLVAPAVGGLFLAITTPLLLDAMSKPASWIAAGATNPGGKILHPYSLPARVPSKGAADAADIMVEFSDLDCPHCAAMHATVAGTMKERGSSGLLVRFVNYPLDASCNPNVTRTLHPTACFLARGGLCAQEQGLFWPYIESVFAIEGPRSPERVVDVARRIGLDAVQFQECLDAPRTARALSEDIALANSARVRATPTVLVNGWTFEGSMPPAKLRRILDDTAPCGCELRPVDGSCGQSTGTAP